MLTWHGTHARGEYTASAGTAGKLHFTITPCERDNSDGTYTPGYKLIVTSNGVFFTKYWYTHRAPCKARATRIAKLLGR